MNATKTLLAAAILAVGGLIGAGTARAQNPFGEATTERSDGKKAEALADEGERLLAKGDHKAALEKFVEAVKYDKTNVKALTGAAFVFNEFKDYETAKLCAAAAALTDKKSANAWRELGYAEWKLGNLTDAKQFLATAIVCNEKNMPAYEYLIAVLEEGGETENAQKVRDLKVKAEGEKKTDLFNLSKGK